MTKRAWWLVGLNILIPGSAQILAGNRRVGRFGVGMTFVAWGLIALAAILWFAWRSLLIGLASNVIALSVIQVLLIVYVVMWIVLTLDTLRLVKIIKAWPKARPFVAGLSVAVLALSVGVVGYGASIAGTARDTISALFADGDYKEPVDGQYNILLLGGDAGADRTGLRPDSISVVSIDAETGAMTIVGIPRNFEKASFSPDSPLWGPFPNGYDCGDECLINYLYTYADEHPELYPTAAAEGSSPGIEATRDAASGVTGLEIQYFVIVDMQGFMNLIDALGGIDVDVPQRTAIGAIEAPEAYYYVEAGPQHFTGDNALWYARSRYESSDYDRMQRQRQVQEAVLTQFTPANVLSKFQAVAEAGTQVVQTDIPSVMISPFVDLGTKSRAIPLTTLELVPGVVDTLEPDYDVIHTLVDETIHPERVGAQG